MNTENPRIITRTAICPICNKPALRVFDNPNVKGGIEMGCGECEYHDPPLETERKQAGILRKLSQKERRALNEVCQLALVYAKRDQNEIGRVAGLVNLLLGEEK